LELTFFTIYKSLELNFESISVLSRFIQIEFFENNEIFEKLMRKKKEQTIKGDYKDLTKRRDIHNCVDEDFLSSVV
jgi:hypothetical protein